MYYPIYININESVENYFTEAVFSGGKEKVSHLASDHIQKIKDELDKRIEEYELSISENKKDRKVAIKSFDPKSFWKNQLFKDFEDELRKVFGFRNVEIHPYIEKYISDKKKFESCELNAAVYHTDRFPVEGLITDNGFYDKSHSINMEIWISLGLIKNLTSDEILAVLLHEFGHSIDPALIDIKYTETNILSKYITDRKKSLNKDENRIINKFRGIVDKSITNVSILVSKILIDPIIDIFTTKEKSMKNKLKKIKEKLKNDKDQFNRQNYSEAFADNFARMYGYGHILMSAIKKLSNDHHDELRSRFKKEKRRQREIYNITLAMIDDEHKTDIHRIRNLINEYKSDINDPNTPEVVKKQLQEDLTELEKVLDQYLNHRDEFQKRINNIINNELKKLEDNDENKDKNESK